MNKNYSNYLSKKNEAEHKLPWKTNVKTFSQIYNDAIEQSGDKFLLDYRLTIEKLKTDIKNNIISMPESNIALIGKTLEYITDKTPMVVIAFSPPYYPHISINDFKELDDNVSDIGNAVVRIAREVCFETYSKRNYFMGISDMSYAALNESENVIPHIEFNMPLWKNMYDIPFETIKQLAIPSINIGPYGKDLHKFTERVFTIDVIRQTPKLITGVIEYVLKNN